MTTYNTGNPIGSTDPKDLYDNAQNLDALVNSTTEMSHADRLAVQRKTWHGMETQFDAAQAERAGEFAQFLADSAYQDLGVYGAGIEVTRYNQVFLKDGEFYRPAASLGLPYTTTGMWASESGSFVGVGDAVLRQDLAASSGSALVGYDGGAAQDVLDDAKPLANYAALRAYTGRATGVRITQAGLAGFFQRDDADTASADNGGTIIVDGAGRRWKRLFVGDVMAAWFGAKTDGTDAVSALTTAAQYACAAKRTLALDAGTYDVSDELDFRTLYGVRIIGHGCNASAGHAGPSTVIRQNAANKRILRVWGPVVLRDFCLIYATQQTTAQTNSIALEFNKVGGADIRNIRAFYGNTNFGIQQIDFDGNGTGNWIFDSDISNLQSHEASETHYDFRNFGGGTNCRIGPLYIGGGGNLDFSVQGQPCNYGIRGSGWQGYEISAVSIDGCIINVAPIELNNCVFDIRTLRFEADTIKSDADGWIKLGGGYAIGEIGILDFKNTRWQPESATSMFIYKINPTIAQFSSPRIRIQSDCNFGSTGSRRALTSSCADVAAGVTNSIKIGAIDDQGAKLSDYVWTDSLSTLQTAIREFNGSTASGYARAGKTSTVKRIVYATAVPTTGTWAFGDVIRVLGAPYGAPHEYTCSSAGTPGTWRPSAQTVRKSTTENRPALRADDIGVIYMDVTLDADGKPIWWNGVSWIDSTGAVV